MQEPQRFCRFCKCQRALSYFSKSLKTKRRVCIEHMRSVYRLRHTVEGGGSIAVDHFRVLKNAYQVLSRDARHIFGGLKPKLRIQDLSPFLSPEGGQFCLPLNPTLPISHTNLVVVASIEQRKTLLRVWGSTRNLELYVATTAHYGSL